VKDAAWIFLALALFFGDAPPLLFAVAGVYLIWLLWLR
jgi:hypothetical protein